MKNITSVKYIVKKFNDVDDNKKKNEITSGSFLVSISCDKIKLWGVKIEEWNGYTKTFTKNMTNTSHQDKPTNKITPYKYILKMFWSSNNCVFHIYYLIFKK